MLQQQQLQPDYILALPRGGVEVAYPIAAHFKKTIDLHYCRKLRSPSNPELAFGSVDRYDTIHLNHSLINQLEITDEYIQKEIAIQRQDIQLRIKKYGASPEIKPKSHCLLVDDGIATGYTMLSACQSLLQQGFQVTIAVPVTSESAANDLSNLCPLICIINDPNLGAIGRYYAHFDQTSDQTVYDLIKKSQSF
ncbi:phosphoribosyltransferase family protein [Gammaproteobacteria bacterium]|nr:phosphoribosyltransferase family protein [Gammaproteobacteria bacterium]